MIRLEQPWCSKGQGFRRCHQSGCPLRDLHPQVVRRGPRAGIQFSRRPAGGVQSLYREPASCRMGHASGHVRRRRPVRRLSES